MTLLDSAKNFLVESLGNYQKEKLAFAILHAVTATELLLKERLSRIHPNLIYRRIDSQQITKEYTVGLKELPQRLVNFGVALEIKEVDLIKTVAKWRHEIVHHMPMYSHKQATASLGLLYDFLGRFLTRELNLELKNVIPKALFKTVSGLMAEWNKVIKEAKQYATAEGNVEHSQECPTCGGIGTICLRKNKAFCHLCDSDLEVGECPICHKRAINSELDFGGNVYHWKCLDDYAQYYIEEMRRNTQLE